MTTRKKTRELTTELEPAPALSKRSSTESHIERIDAAIYSTTKTLLENLYVDDLQDAYKVMDRLRGEEHVRELRDERHELEFYVKRRAELVAELEQLTLTAGEEQHG